jgi:hypothetical protein
LNTKPAVKAKIVNWLDKGYKEFAKSIAGLNGTGRRRGL